MSLRRGWSGEGDLEERQRAGGFGAERGGKERGELEIVMKEAPVADHQANGVSENAVKNVQGQFRALKDDMESRANRGAEGDLQAVPWRVTHAATVIKKGRNDDDGFTAYRRWRGREFTRPVAGLGESILCWPAGLVG